VAKISVHSDQQFTREFTATTAVYTIPFEGLWLVGFAITGLIAIDPARAWSSSTLSIAIMKNGVELSQQKLKNVWDGERIGQQYGSTEYILNAGDELEIMIASTEPAALTEAAIEIACIAPVEHRKNASVMSLETTTNRHILLETRTE
jgi:hypothetical protein